MKKDTGIVQQLSKNSLSIISLALAILALTYNTWRSNTSEENRNYRTASFELILQLSELQHITNELHFNAPNEKSTQWDIHHDRTLVEGWSHIALIEDLSTLMPYSFHSAGEKLKATWQTNHRRLGSNDSAEQDITKEITRIRKMTRDFLKDLN